MKRVRIQIANSEHVDFPADQCAVTEWATKLQYPDAVITVEGDADDVENAGHTVYIPVRAILGVETYEQEEPPEEQP